MGMLPPVSQRATSHVEVLSKHCQVCATHHEMNTSSDEILDWWEGHQASCEVNYCGLFSAMQSTGALAIWKRSVIKNMLMYTQMISDGNSKLAALWCVQPGEQT